MRVDRIIEEIVAKDVVRLAAQEKRNQEEKILRQKCREMKAVLLKKMRQNGVHSFSVDFENQRYRIMILEGLIDITTSLLNRTDYRGSWEHIQNEYPLLQHLFEEKE